MQKVFFLLLLFSFFGCSNKVQKSLSYAPLKVESRILLQSIIENYNKNKSSLTVLTTDENSKDTIGAHLHYKNCNEMFEEGEQSGSLIDHVIKIANLKGGYYNIKVSSLGHMSLIIDSLNIEKGKSLFLQVSLIPVVY